MFTAFFVPTGENQGPRVGITVPRALGGAVVRNRIKRRIREAVRARLSVLSPQWQVVINPRRRALTAGFPELVQEIEKLFLRCNAQR